MSQASRMIEIRRKEKNIKNDEMEANYSNEYKIKFKFG